MLVIDQVLGRPVVPVDYGKVPWCVYTFPEVAFAGYSEESAREAGFEVVTKKDPYRGNGRALIIGEPEGLVKVIAEKLPDGSAGRLLGVHMVGPWVTEQLGQGYLAVNWDATADDVAHSCSRTHHCRRFSARPCSPSLEGVFTLADITMPQLGETVTEGTITKWHKQVGDAVAEDEVLFEVSTDKVDSEVPSPVNGTVTEILVPEGRNRFGRYQVGGHRPGR